MGQNVLSVLRIWTLSMHVALINNNNSNENSNNYNNK